MRIAVASVQVPFIGGGAEYLAEGLLRALREAGHSVDLITMPFRFNKTCIIDSIAAWKKQDFSTFDVGSVDGVIALKFPAYNLVHDNKVVWLLHQHRAVYDLLDTQWGETSNDPHVIKLRQAIVDSDNQSLDEAKSVFTISKTVSRRLKQYNKINSQPLYHPPPDSEYYESGPIFPYVFCPSRLESLKRQDLLIRAMRFVDKPVFAVIAGEGGMRQAYQKLAEDLGVQDRVRMMGYITSAQKRRYYSNCLAVFFGPYEEDLGYITLEAMLSEKPVISCHDSGGPTEFIIDEKTGFITEPDPHIIGEKINELWSKRTRVKEMGSLARDYYKTLKFSWSHAIDALVGDLK